MSGLGRVLLASLARGQGYGSISYKAQDKLPQQRIIWHKASVVLRLGNTVLVSHESITSNTEQSEKYVSLFVSLLDKILLMDKVC